MTEGFGLYPSDNKVFTDSHSIIPNSLGEQQGTHSTIAKPDRLLVANGHTRTLHPTRPKSLLVLLFAAIPADT